MLAGRTVVLGVSGGIAAYKAAEIVRWLKKEGASVVVVMTKAAREFISPLTLATLSGNPVLDDLWAPNQALNFARPKNRTSAVEHIEVADAADLVIVAPATADVIGKAANGLADDMVTTVLLATRAPVVYAPAMNVQMLEHPAVQANLATLARRGAFFADAESGDLACGWEGRGRLASIEAIAAACERALGGGVATGPLAGRRVVVTAGPTIEALDPVRALTNHSSGKMGYALAEALKDLGATVTLVSGPTALAAPAGMAVVAIRSARDLGKALAAALANADALVMAAAVADYRPARAATEKIKRQPGAMTLELVPNPDLLKSVKRPRGLKVVGFALESANGLASAKKKLREKNCDLLVLNSPAALGGDTNEITILDAGGGVERLPVLAKRAAAERIAARLAALFPRPKAAKRSSRAR
jgi:phosphopantothenoylcysteine decarboxylase/phosphopantothenate--cysteine ligase